MTVEQFREKTFGSYRILIQPGSIPQLIIIGAGIGRPQEDTPDNLSMEYEWKSTIEKLARPEHVIYLQDRNRSWFNDREGWEDLAGYIRDYRESHGIKRTVGLGLSMGASGIAALDHQIHIDRVIMLSPQALIGAAFDDRYQVFWNRIKSVETRNMASLLRETGNYHLLLTIDDKHDLTHANYFRQGIVRVRISAVRGVHNIGSEMKRRGLLQKFLGALLDDDDDSLRTCGVFDCGNAPFEIAERAFRDKICYQDVGKEILELGTRDGKHLPSFLFKTYQDAAIGANLEQGQISPLVPYPAHSALVIPESDYCRYVVHGWSASRHNWLLGAHQLIRMRVIDFPSFPSCRLQLSLQPLLHEKHRAQRVQISLGQSVILNRRIELGGPDAAGFTCSIQLASQDVELHIATPDCVRPVDLGVNNDGRWLSARLKRMELFPL